MSEEKDLNNNEQDTAGAAKENTSTDQVSSEQEKKEPSAEERYTELNENYLRLHAEFDNYRKRTNREKLEIISTGNAAIIKDLLPILDDFERAIENNKTVEDVKVLKEGFTLIFNKFNDILASKGVQPMNSTGGVFDVEIHEAIANIPAPSKKLRGKVIEAMEKGYYLNDKVIRFAKVIVGK